MGGAVQYLEHAPQDERHYLVWVKTNTGNRPVIIPIEAVRLMQSQKPSAAMIASIKRQLAGEPFVELASDTSYTPSPAGPLLKLGRWLRGILSRANKPPTSR